MKNITRISHNSVKEKVSTGALLVCAYENEQLFLRNQLAGAISLHAFEERLPSLDKNAEIIFYCA
jgi:hypothetical protein